MEAFGVLAAIVGLIFAVLVLFAILKLYQIADDIRSLREHFVPELTPADQERHKKDERERIRQRIREDDAAAAMRARDLIEKQSLKS